MKFNGHGSQLDRLNIEVGPGQRGGRLVVATLGGREYRNRLDTDNAFQRRKCREDIVGEFELPEDAHEFVERQLLAKADAADAEPVGLWQPSVVTAAEVTPLQTRWLWENYFALGSLSGLDGDPGLGKSQLTIDIGARVSRGDAMPPQTAPEGTYNRRGVLLLNYEDDPARTTIPRLKAAGADLSRVHILRSMRCEMEADERPVKLPYDLASIEQIIRDNDVAFMPIDPFVASLESELNVNNDADVRRCLGQLATVAENTGCAILLVRHLNKKSGLSAVYRGGGSIGITGACRSVLMVGRDPVDADSRILAPVKSNLCQEPPSLRFSIESFGDTSRVSWGESCDISAHDVLDAAGKQCSGKGGKSDAAKALLVELLRDGPRAVTEVEQSIREAGITDATFRRAKAALAIRSDREGFGASGQWMLALPEPEGETW